MFAVIWEEQKRSVMFPKGCLKYKTPEKHGREPSTSRLATTGNEAGAFFNIDFHPCFHRYGRVAELLPFVVPLLERTTFNRSVYYRLWGVTHSARLYARGAPALGAAGAAGESGPRGPQHWGVSGGTSGLTPSRPLHTLRYLSPNRHIKLFTECDTAPCNTE